MTISFLYFDVGNVLVHFSHERMCQQMADVAGADVALVRQLLLTADDADACYQKFETGRLDCDAYYEAFCRRTGTRPDRNSLEKAGADIFEPIEPMLQLVDRLASAGHRLGLLSNSNPLHWDFITDGRYPLLAPPSVAGSPWEIDIASHIVRVMKPDPRIYQLAIERAGVAAEDIFFVDDRPENVAAARAAGMDAVEFTGLEQMRTDLSQRGVRPAG